MSITDHALHIDFPEHIDTISQLRQADEEFRQLSDEYDALDKKIRGLEVREVPTDDQHFNELKQTRARLKDSLYKRFTRY